MLANKESTMKTVLVAGIATLAVAGFVGPTVAGCLGSYNASKASTITTAQVETTERTEGR